MSWNNEAMADLLTNMMTYDDIGEVMAHAHEILTDNIGIDRMTGEQCYRAGFSYNCMSGDDNDSIALSYLQAALEKGGLHNDDEAEAKRIIAEIKGGAGQ